MVKSQNGLVSVNLINPLTKEPFPELIGHDKVNYIIGESNQNFQIRLITTKKFAIYGCSLTIDGQMICASKSFKDVGHFFGFKRSTDEYEMFQFMIPEIMQDSNNFNHKIIKELKEKMGRIVIEIYGTKRIQLRKHFDFPKKNNFQTEYTPMKRFQDKKLFHAPLTVKRGGIFKNNRSFNKKNGDDNFVDRMDQNNHLDTVVIRYSDFYTLVISDHINLYNIDHLKFIPINFIRKNLFLLEKMIITIIHSFKRIEKSGLSERLIHEELKRYIKMRFEELGAGSLRDYLISKKEIFVYNPETDKFMLKDPKFKVCYETLNDLKPGNLIDPKYYAVPMDKENFIFKKPEPKQITINLEGKNFIVID